MCGFLTKSFTHVFHCTHCATSLTLPVYAIPVQYRLPPLKTYWRARHTIQKLGNLINGHRKDVEIVKRQEV
ncbi:hypothetical protein BJX99DRAFT_223245 [Aspergillus californicus]